ncbi:MAG: GNAT family N-acetyltransferase [Bacilli bacterium]|nr:GNAT family N-acetyltransferase [Bacilli bacterium]
MIELKKLSINDGLDVYNMLQDIPLDENGYHNSANGITYEEYKEWLVKKEKDANQVGIIDGWRVPQTTFVLYEDGVPVGYGSIRHFLTDALREVGGHIGYCISPLYRKKGYGKEILKRLIIEARAMGIKDILVTTNLDNYASQKVIIANGGKEIDRSTEHIHFWIYE